MLPVRLIILGGASAWQRLNQSETKKQIRELTEYYLHKGQLRNYVLIVMGVHTALRMSDLLRLRWNDVYDFRNVRIKANITIIEKKTKKVKIIALNRNC